MRRFLVAFSLVLFVVAAHASPFDPSAQEAVIEVRGDAVLYVGAISELNIERFMEVVQGKEISVLTISSGGGEINAGMTMGEWVFGNGVDVVVERMCMSSCANYVFTAGRRKTINPGSIVAWHGNILQKTGLSEDEVRAATLEMLDRLPQNEKEKIDREVVIAQTLDQARDYQRRSVERQDAFFARIGVDEYICRVGNEEYGADDFFLLAPKDMARFGLTGVRAPHDYDMTDLTPFRNKGKSIEFIRLD